MTLADPTQAMESVVENALAAAKDSGASQADVENAVHNYGCYNTAVKMLLEYFGETNAGVKVGKAAAADTHHAATVHTEELLDALCAPAKQELHS